MRSLKLRASLVAVAFVVLAAACSGGSDDDEAQETQAPGSSPNQPSGPQGDAPDLGEALRDAGVTIIDDPASAPPITGLQLWSWQVENLEQELADGGGYLGVQLDEIAGAPGGLPFSYLIAGWMDSGVTDTAVTARELMGDQPLAEAPSLGYPTAVLVLFVADALQVAAEDSPQAMATGELAANAQQGVCTTLANWVSNALDWVFNGLKVDVEGSGFFAWLGAIWNSAVEFARGVVETAIETITAPIRNAIKSGLAVVGALSMIGSLLSRWTIDVEPSNTGVTLPVGGEPDVEEMFTARVDTNVEFNWDPFIEDCARAAGLTLPDPRSAARSEVRWQTTGLTKWGTLKEFDTQIDSDNEATLTWTPTREDSRTGTERTSYVVAHVTVVNEEYSNLRSMVWTLINGKISGVPFEGTVRSGIEALLEPIFNRLVELVEFHGQGAATVVYHEGEAGSIVTILNPDTGCNSDADLQETLVFDEGSLDDSSPDSVDYLIRVDDLVPAAAADLLLNVSAGYPPDVKTASPVPVATGRQVDLDSWVFSGTIPLDTGLARAELIEVRAWIDLPDGSREMDVAWFHSHYQSDLETAERVVGGKREQCAAPVVSILNPHTGCSQDALLQETLLYEDGSLDDSTRDSVDYAIRVDDVLDGTAGDLFLNISAGYPPNVTTANPVRLGTGRQLDGDSWLISGTIQLGRSLARADLIEVRAWIDLPDGSRAIDVAWFHAHYQSDLDTAERVVGEERAQCSDPTDPPEPPDEVGLLEASGFTLHEQRFNVYLLAREVASEGDDRVREQIHRVSVASFEVDDRQSTETRDDTQFPIDRLGFDGYTFNGRSVSEGSAYAFLASEFHTSTPTSSEIAISGDFARTLTGSSVGEDDPTNDSIAYGSVGILFSFTGNPLRVRMVWDCGLEIRLADITDRENPMNVFFNRWDPPVTLEAPLTDDHVISDDKITRECDQIVPTFEGTLQPDTVYQLVLDFGYFAGRYASEGKVWVQARVLDETGRYDVHETNTFVLTLTEE